MALTKIVHPWYSFDKIESYDCMINGVIGGRGIGKTYGRKVKSIKKWFKKGEQFILLRRYSKELAAARRSFFADIADEFPDWDTRAQGEYAQVAPVETRGHKGREWTTIGYFIALSTAQMHKGTSFPLVTTILFDEAILEEGPVQYLKDEVTALLNFYSTVDRNQSRVKLWLLANSVSIMNPYFIRWKIRPDELTGEWFTLPGGDVVFHFPNDEAFKASVSNTRFGKFIDQTEPDYAAYAVGNQFADNHLTMLGIKDPKSRYRFTLETKNGKFSVWKNAFTGEYFIQEKLPRDELVYTLERAKMSRDKQLMSFSDVPLARLRGAFNKGQVTFDDQTTRNSFIDIFKR